MKQSIERMGKTVDEAIQAALKELAITEDEALIEVLDEGEAGGLLGFGRRSARVRVSRVGAEEETEDISEEETTVTYSEEDEDADEHPERKGAEDLTDAEREEAENRAVDFVAGVLQSLDIHGRISSYYDDDACLRIDVTGKDIGNAIGRRGETLEALQYLVTLSVNRKSDHYVRVILDIGKYRERRIRTLRQQARRCAGRVLHTGRRYVMEPMSPAERRQVHMALADFQGVTTYSEGVEPRRSVVIAPDDEN